MQDDASSNTVFLRCLEGILTAIACECHAGRLPDHRAFAREAEAVFSFHAETGRQDLPASMDEVKKFILEQADKQRLFYDSLRELRNRADDAGQICEILNPGEYLSPAFWDVGVVPGCTLRFNRKFLFTAYPLAPARTEYFLTLTQGPLAADLVWVSDGYILFLQEDQDPDGHMRRALEALYGPLTFQDVRVAGFIKGIRRSNIIVVISEEMPAEQTLDRVMEEFKVPAVLVSGIDGLFSELYAGGKNEMPGFIKQA